ncbi:hypothetical protein LWI28_011066 [Acer negundo]|uniref:Uncharacterized protein n=1 Tax=Acer negundo TaxID=4023 RepID=A0AAD5NP86_ACENE|nr:hypothetical protein LWI28_011066 [Acer negundo]
MALTTKNKDGFVDGTVTKLPLTLVKEYKQWTRYNLLVKGWILNTISIEIAQSVMYNDNAFEKKKNSASSFYTVLDLGIGNSTFPYDLEETIYTPTI